MDTIPKRSVVAMPYRRILDKFESYLFLPFKNPDAYTISAVILSVLFLFTAEINIRITLLILILLLDWADGAAARRYRGITASGYMVDVVYDRISEGIITASILGTWYGNILFLLYIINIILMFYAIKKGTSYLFAVRFFYLIILFVQFISHS